MGVTVSHDIDFQLIRIEFEERRHPYAKKTPIDESLCFSEPR